jgi:hypothetical protein
MEARRAKAKREEGRNERDEGGDKGAGKQVRTDTSEAKICPYYPSPVVEER